MSDVRISLVKMHAEQRRIYRHRAKRTVIRCGRRFGKSTMLESAAANWAINGKLVGWFCPDYKKLLPTYGRILRMLRPCVARSSKIDGIIELTTGGSVEFWTLNDKDAGRSRFYDEVVIDEASLVPGLREIWEQSISPTLLDRDGNCTMAGTPKGIDDENFFYQACTNKVKTEAWPEVWLEFHAPTSSNPTLNKAAVEALKDKYPALVYQQEYLAEFVDWSGAAFFSLDKLLVDGKGIAMPRHVDYVFAVIDSALKDGHEHDGTAVVYYAVSKFHGTPLAVLDWDVVQINSDLLITWMPSVFKRLEDLSKECKAINGSLGAFIEDKASGITLNQHAQRVGWPATAIDGEITGVGKDGRAVMASGPVFRGEVKLTDLAHKKTVEYKKITRNHLVFQVCGYRLGDKDAAKRADDLADGFTYGVIIGLGGPDGF